MNAKVWTALSNPYEVTCSWGDCDDMLVWEPDSFRDVYTTYTHKKKLVKRSFISRALNKGK